MKSRRSALRLVLGISICMACCGCYLFSPDVFIFYLVEGTLVDEETGQPLMAAEIRACLLRNGETLTGGSTYTPADENGAFDVDAGALLLTYGILPLPFPPPPLPDQVVLAVTVNGCRQLLIYDIGPTISATRGPSFVTVTFEMPVLVPTCENSTNVALACD